MDIIIGNGGCDFPFKAKARKFSTKLKQAVDDNDPLDLSDPENVLRKSKTKRGKRRLSKNTKALQITALALGVSISILIWLAYKNKKVPNNITAIIYLPIKFIKFIKSKFLSSDSIDILEKSSVDIVEESSKIDPDIRKGLIVLGIAAVLFGCYKLDLIRGGLFKIIEIRSNDNGTTIEETAKTAKRWMSSRTQAVTGLVALVGAVATTPIAPAVAAVLWPLSYVLISNTPIE